jgi:hypothetical protein
VAQEGTGIYSRDRTRVPDFSGDGCDGHLGLGRASMQSITCGCGRFFAIWLGVDLNRRYMIQRTIAGICRFSGSVRLHQIRPYCFMCALNKNQDIGKNSKCPSHRLHSKLTEKWLEHIKLYNHCMYACYTLFGIYLSVQENIMKIALVLCSNTNCSDLRHKNKIYIPWEITG